MKTNHIYILICFHVLLANIETIPRKLSSKKRANFSSVIQMTKTSSMKTLATHQTKPTTGHINIYTNKFQTVKCKHNRKCWKSITSKSTTTTTRTSTTEAAVIETIKIFFNTTAVTTSKQSTVSMQKLSTAYTAKPTLLPHSKSTKRQFKYNFTKLFPNFDPNVNMSYFNPLKLTSNQTGILQNLQKGICWKRSYMRGIGSVVTYCRPEKEKDGALCYPKCDDGYQGVGPLCWEICRPEYTDRGL